MSIDIKLFSEHLIWAEGKRNFPYEDSVGLLTIGVGRNLEERGLSDDEINYLLKNDIAIVLHDAGKLPYFDELNGPRKIVVADMIFNLGINRFLGFVRTNEALAMADYGRAADEMSDSKWFRQVGRRAEKLVRVMRSGVWE